MNNTFYHWGCIIVPPGYADPVRFRAGTPYGAGHTSGDGRFPPGESRPAAVEFQATRLVQVVATFLRGRLP